MVETITPVVHGERRGRWVVIGALHVVGAGLSAGLLGGLLGAVGHLLWDPRSALGALVAGGVAILYAGRELFGLPIPLPDRRGQVPEWWRSSLPPPAASFLYGLLLGTGFLTHLRHGTIVAVAAMAFISADPLAGAAALAPFGLVRGLSVVVAAAAVPQRGAGVIARLESIGSSAGPRIANGSLLLVVAVVSLSMAGSMSGDATAFVAGLSATLVAGVFALSGGAKVARFAPWRRALEVYRFPPFSVTVVAAAVPIAELAVPLLMAAGRMRAGSVVALVLLAAFSAAILRARAIAGNRVPCGCFGGRERRDYRLLLGRNLAVAGVAVAAVVRPAPVLAALRPPEPSEILPAVLIAAGLLCLVWIGRRLIAIRGTASSM